MGSATDGLNNDDEDKSDSEDVEIVNQQVTMNIEMINSEAGLPSYEDACRINNINNKKDVHVYTMILTRSMYSYIRTDTLNNMTCTIAHL